MLSLNGLGSLGAVASAGVATALQRAINGYIQFRFLQIAKLAVDGKIGAKTVAAAQACLEDIAQASLPALSLNDLNSRADSIGRQIASAAGVAFNTSGGSSSPPPPRPQPPPPPPPPGQDPVAKDPGGSLLDKVDAKTAGIGLLVVGAGIALWMLLKPAGVDDGQAGWY